MHASNSQESELFQECRYESCGWFWCRKVCEFEVSKKVCWSRNLSFSPLVSKCCFDFLNRHNELNPVARQFGVRVTLSNLSKWRWVLHQTTSHPRWIKQPPSFTHRKANQTSVLTTTAYLQTRIMGAWMEPCRCKACPTTTTWRTWWPLRQL